MMIAAMSAGAFPVLRPLRAGAVFGYGRKFIQAGQSWLHSANYCSASGLLVALRPD
jgi:hypothetical protein